MGLIDFIDDIIYAAEDIGDFIEDILDKKESTPATPPQSNKKNVQKINDEDCNFLDQEDTDLYETKQQKTAKTMNSSSNLYDANIEQLINCALIDGKLTDKEKQILFKKAQAKGIDLDEFEMVLDARLVELERQEKEKSPRSNKHGGVRKCPACGAIVPSLTVVCAECGFEFSGVEANYSSQKLAKEIVETQAKYNDKINRSLGEDKKWELRKQAINTIAQIIKSFPLPTTKDDLFEFLATMQVKMSDPTIQKQEGAAYFAKYNEAMIKASALFSEDPLFLNFIQDKDNVITQYNKNHKKQKGIGLKPSDKHLLLKCTFWAIPILLIIVTILTLWYLNLLGVVLAWVGDALIVIGEVLLGILFIAIVIIIILSRLW